jgi:hypothetical protein
MIKASEKEITFKCRSLLSAADEGSEAKRQVNKIQNCTCEEKSYFVVAVSLLSSAQDYHLV